ncbi:MAG TPA: hypothetical protein VKE27_01660 [Candidatus Dormibacteraeota bacterium]|nr:hypothetical protein [Candidatus Dormibacteraeota bacterium]
MSGIIRNLGAGKYTPVERVRRILANLARRRPDQTCCGNYGEPGC